jgi:hypothetical protein
MTIERQRIEATEGEKVVGTYYERAEAERAVAQLHSAGFGEDQITMTTIGGHKADDGTFQRGRIEVAVLADERGDEAERILSATAPREEAR